MRTTDPFVCPNRPARLAALFAGFLFLLALLGYTPSAWALGKIAMMPSYAQNQVYATVGMNQNIDVWGRAWGGSAPYNVVLFYGDGSSNSWTGQTESQMSFYVGASHSYSAAGSKAVTMVVTDSTNGVLTGSAIIRVLSSPAHADKVNMAIEKGLLYLYKNQTSSGAGTERAYWYTANNGYYLGIPAFCLLAFEENGHLPGNDYQQDVYAQTVQRGLNMLAYNAYAATHTSPAGRLAGWDSNGNGRGICTTYGTYSDSLSTMAFIMAFNSTNAAKAATIPAGQGTFAGINYYDFAVDMVDQLYYSQNGISGWHYSVDPDASGSTGNDGSTHQWPNIAMLTFNQRWGMTINSTILSNSMTAFQTVQNANGGCGYSSSGQWCNSAKTGGMLGGYSLGGKLTGDDNVNRGLTFLGNLWNSDPDYANSGSIMAGGWAGDFYAMYGVKKGLQLQGVTTVTASDGAHDWYQDMSAWLLGNASLLGANVAAGYRTTSWGYGQLSDGSWTGASGSEVTSSSYGAPVTTANAILVLTKAVTKPLPIAAIAAIPDQSSKHPAAFLLDGSGSYHMDPNSSIVEYLWAFGTNVDWANSYTNGRTAMVNPNWTNPGTYTVNLMVKDNNSPSNTATATITVNVINTDVAPVAVPIPPGRVPAVYTTKVGGTVTFDGSGSYDPDGDAITDYAWDLNGDGVFGNAADAALDTSGNAAHGVTATVLYNSSYNGQIGLQVTANGKTSSNSTAVDVYASPSDLAVTTLTAANVVPGVSANIHAVVTNDATSGQGFNSVLVKFYDRNPMGASAQLGSNYLVNLPVGGSVTINISPLALNGATNVWVYVDANNAIAEFSETNNTAAVDVSSANNPPVVSNPIGTQNATYNTVFSFAFPSNTFTDPDGNAMTYTASGLPTGITLDGPSRTFSGTPTVPGNYSVQLVANDGGSPVGLATNTFTLAVGKAAASVDIAGLSQTYDGTGRSATAGTTPSGLTVNLTYNGVSAAPTNAGSYTVIGTIADVNYAGSATNTLVVAPAPLGVIADNQVRLYGQANPTLTMSYSGFMPGDNAANQFSVLPSPATTAVPASPRGTYAITVSGGTAPNYSLSYTNGVLTVNKTPLTMTGDSFTRPYGQTNPIFTAVVTGVVNGDNITPRFSFTSSVTTNTPPGMFKIVLNVTDPDSKLGNYDATLTSGYLTITNALLVGQVASQSRPYGETNAPFTVNYSGFVNSQGTNLLTGVLGFSCLDSNSVATDTNTVVGSYPITVTSPQTAQYYDVIYLDGTLSVTAPVLMVNAHAETRVYGQANPTFSASITGFVNGEDAGVLGGTLSLTTAAVTNSPVGQYAIVPSGLSSANYSIVFSNAMLTVTPAGLVVSADAASRAYGALNPVFTGTCVGATAGDNLTATFATAAVTNSPVGGYDIFPVWQDPDSRLGNYTVTTNLGTLTVGRALLTVTADNRTRVYGAVNPTLTASYSGFVNAEGAGVLSGAPSVTTLADTNTPVGAYTLTAAVGTLSAANYSFAYVDGTLTITQAVLTVTADHQSRVYGETNPVFTASYAGFANGDTTNVLSGAPDLSTIAITNSPVGDYTIAAAAGTLGATNYSFAFVNGTLTIGKAALTVTADNLSRAYGETNPVFTASYSGFVDGDTTAVLSGSPSLTTLATTNSPVGGYTITAAVGTLTATNYALSFVDGSLSVTQALLTVTANNASRVYGNTNPPLTGTLVGIRNNDNLTAAYSTVATPATPVGSYDIVPSILDPGAKLANYSVITNLGSLTITQANLVVSADSKNRLYGASNPAFTGTLVGVTNNDNLTVAFVTAATSASPVSSYNIVPSWNDPDSKLSNYSVVTNVGTLTINKATLTATADNQNRPYGSANPELTISYSGWQNSDGVGLLTTLPAASTTATPGSWLGNYPITVTGGSSSNYLFSYVSGTLNIGKAQLFVVGDDAGRPYGQLNPSFSATMTGAYPADNLSFILSTTATTNSLPGLYDINIFLVDPNSRLGAYDVTLTSGTLAITNAVLIGHVASQTRAYGQTNAPFTLVYTGFVNGQASNILTGAITYTSVDSHGVPTRTNTTVGAYAIHATGQHASNYTVTYADGTLTVTQAVLSVTANNQARDYGQPNPTFTASYSGFRNGDTTSVLSGAPALSTAADATAAAGPHTITAALGTLSATNYSFVFTDGTLTVNKIGLVVTADNISRAYGLPNPTFTASYTGFANGENAGVLSGAPSLTTTADTNSVVGPYTITSALGSLSSGNYTFSFANGTLTVTQAVLTVTAVDQIKIYGATNPVFTASYTGFLNGDTTNVLSGAPSLTTTAGTNSGVGSYLITAAAGNLSAGNYGFNFVNGHLTVNAAQITVTANNASRLYGAANPTFSASYSGFVNGETTNVLSGAPSLTTTATATSPVGAYSITAAQGSMSAANYNFAYTAGTLTVGVAPLAITANDAVRVYGDTNPVFTGHIVGILNSDPISADYTNAATPSSPVGTYPTVPVVVDPSGVSSNYVAFLTNGTLTIVPALTMSGSAGAYGVSNAPALVDTNASLADGGGLNFSNTTLRVTVVTNATSLDRLAIRSLGNGAGQIGVSGSSISYGGVVIASFTGGSGTNALVITFNTNATSTAATALIDAVTFSTDSNTYGSRTIQLAYTYGQTTVTAIRVISIDRSPIAVPDVLQVAAGETLTIPFSVLLANDIDADGDTLTISAYSSLSAYGATLSTSGTNFIFTPPAIQTNTFDVFSYQITDGRGASSITQVTLQLLAANRMRLDTSNLKTTGNTVTMPGTPGRTYQIQTSTNLVNWILLDTVVADPMGIVRILDSQAKNNPKRFYRALAQ